MKKLKTLTILSIIFSLLIIISEAHAGGPLVLFEIFVLPAELTDGIKTFNDSHSSLLLLTVAAALTAHILLIVSLYRRSLAEKYIFIASGQLLLLYVVLFFNNVFGSRDADALTTYTSTPTFICIVYSIVQLIYLKRSKKTEVQGLENKIN